MADNQQPTPAQTGPSPAFPVGDDFSNDSERNAGEQTDSQTAWEVNRKRTYDVYQHMDLELFRDRSGLHAKLDNIAVQALQNSVETANMVGKQAVKHADVAADALWTDELNPVTKGAGNVLTGQSPVNAQLSSTGSIETVFGNLATAIVGLAQTVSQANVAITNTNAAMVALLAQLVTNAQQPSPAAKA